MSDENERPTSIADAQMARALGLPLGSVMVAEISADDPIWKTTPLRITAGMARAVAALGLKEGTDWPSEIKPGEPCSELSEAPPEPEPGTDEYRAEVERLSAEPDGRPDWLKPRTTHNPLAKLMRQSRGWKP
jgi:hypothetical protein